MSESVLRKSFAFTKSMRRSGDRNKNRLVVLLLVAWLTSTVMGFWWFQFKNIQAFDSAALKNQAVFFHSGELGQRLESLVAESISLAGVAKAPVSVIHFWNPDCSCTRFNETHVKKIIAEYSGQNVEFTIVVAGETQKIRQQRKKQAQAIFNHGAVTRILTDWPMERGPVSSPAAAVINRSGELVYYGPYSLGAQCDPAEGKFVEKVLNQVKLGKEKRKLNTLAVGCFCPWRNKSEVRS